MPFADSPSCWPSCWRHIGHALRMVGNDVPKQEAASAGSKDSAGYARAGSMGSTVMDSGDKSPSKIKIGEHVRDKPPSKIKIWEHVRDAVRLFGDRGGECRPQPLFDCISALMTIDPEAQRLCGIHAASLHIGANVKVARALVPLVEGSLKDRLIEPGQVSLSARTPRDERGLRLRLEHFIAGKTRVKDPELLNAIHAQDVDWADVDNGAAVLSLAHCLKKSGAKHPLHAFVSERRFTAEFAPAVVHRDADGSPIKTADGSIQYRVSANEDLSSYEVVTSILPYVRELEFETKVHNQQDMSDLAHFECDILRRQLQRAGLGDTVVRQSGTFELAGVSGNVHKLTWYMYEHDGSTRKPEDYRRDVEDYFSCGVGDSTARRKLFREYIKPHTQTARPEVIEDFFAYCRQHPDDKIVVHCGGPLCLIRALADQADLRERVILIGAMFLTYDGSANLLGTNFNEGVAPALTQEIFGEDGKQLHRSFPNARVLCVTTETCKSPDMFFIPFAGTLGEAELVNKQDCASSQQEVFQLSKKDSPALLIISDDGKDPDDELAKILLSNLTQRGLVKCLGMIGNLNPAKERARLSRGTLDQLGMRDIPVAVGQDMISSSSSNYEFNVPYLGSLDDCKPNGVLMFVEILEGLDENTKATLVCLSGLTDAWLLYSNHSELFRKKLNRVVIMGGVECDGDKAKLDEEGFMIPDKAQNNAFDFSSAQQLYKELQRDGIPLTIVTRWAAYAAKLPFSVYDDMAKTKHPVGIRLQEMQQHSLEHLWKRAVMAADDPLREGLPGRCDQAWFCKIFLGGQGQDRTGEDSIWDLASSFQAYDPMALLSACLGLRARFFRPLLVDVEGKHGVTQHEILGFNEATHGVAETKTLSDFIHKAMVEGLQTAMEANSKPTSRTVQRLDSAEPKDGTAMSKCGSTRS